MTCDDVLDGQILAWNMLLYGTNGKLSKLGLGYEVQVLKSYRGPFPRCQGPLKQLNRKSGLGLVLK